MLFVYLINGMVNVQLVIITIIGLLLRLINIDKPEGLWNDEYVSWAISAKPFAAGFLAGIKSQCHMPFYYIYLKACMAWGGQSDIFLRITSVIPCVLSIIVMYFVGLQKDKRTALIASFFTAISSFLIYYSQEVRLYSLLFLFSSLSLLYFLRYLKNQNGTNLGGLILFNFLIMFTHTIGFVFVILQLIVLSCFMFKTNKKRVAILWVSMIASGIILYPFIYHILSTKSFSQWWGTFTFSKIVFLFSDYFSPVLTNLTNAPSNIFYVHSIGFLIFAYVTTILAVFFIIKACIKNKVNIALISIAAGVILVLITAAISGKLVFITKYSIEIYPILLFLFACGLADINKDVLRNTIIAIVACINLTYLFFSPVSAPKLPRTQGHNIVAYLLEDSQIEKGDIILFEYYPSDRFKKYIDLSDYSVYSFNKGNFYKYLTENSSYNEAVNNGKNTYKEIFLAENNPYYNKVLDNKLLKNLQKGQSIHLIINNSVAIYPIASVKEIAENETIYDKVPLLFLVFSYINEYTTDYLSKELKITNIERIGDWTTVKLTKLNN